MMTVLLAYRTTDGQTGKICQFLSGRLTDPGHRTVLANVGAASPAPDTDRNEAVLVAESLHAGRYQSDIVKYVRTHRTARETRTSAFLSVSLAAARTDEDDLAGLNACVGGFTHEAGRTPRVIHPVAGAFRYTACDCMKRRAMHASGTAMVPRPTPAATMSSLTGSIWPASPPHDHRCR